MLWNHVMQCEIIILLPVAVTSMPSRLINVTSVSSVSIPPVSSKQMFIVPSPSLIVYDDWEKLNSTTRITKNY